MATNYRVKIITDNNKNKKEIIVNFSEKNDAQEYIEEIGNLLSDRQTPLKRGDSLPDDYEFSERHIHNLTGEKIIIKFEKLKNE